MTIVSKSYFHTPQRKHIRIIFDQKHEILDMRSDEAEKTNYVLLSKRAEKTWVNYAGQKIIYS